MQQTFSKLGGRLTCDACARPQGSAPAPSLLERTCRCPHTSDGSSGAPNDFQRGRHSSPWPEPSTSLSRTSSPPSSPPEQTPDRPTDAPKNDSLERARIGGSSRSIVWPI